MDITRVKKEIKNEEDLNQKIEIFEKTAIPYMDALYRTALRLTRNEKDAEDLVQEAYLRAFKSFHQFTLGTNCKAWMFKIMTNLHINNYQKKSRKPTKLSLDDIEDFYLYNRITENVKQTNIDTVEEEVLNSFLDTEIRDAIEKLPYEFRVAVILADIEGFRYQEIADIMDCPIGTVRSRLSRGRRLLEKYLWDYAQRKNIYGENCSMTCDEAVEKLVDYVHEELKKEENGSVKEHLKECKLCCTRFQFEDKLTEIIHKKAGKENCPEEVKKNIRAKLKSLL